MGEESNTLVGVDPEQESGAPNKTEGGVGALESAQSDGVSAMEREQTSLKWGYEEGPVAVSEKYKSVLQSTHTNLGTRITELREMMKGSQHSVTHYQEDDAEIAERFRRAARSDTVSGGTSGLPGAGDPAGSPAAPQPTTPGYQPPAAADGQTGTGFNGSGS